MTNNPHRGDRDHKEIYIYNNFNSINSENINNVNDENVASSSSNIVNRNGPLPSLFKKQFMKQYNEKISKKQQNHVIGNNGIQGTMDYEEFSLNQSAAEVLTDSGVLALHVLGTEKNPLYIRQKMKRYLAKIPPE